MVGVEIPTKIVSSLNCGILTSVSNGNHFAMSGNLRISETFSELTQRVNFWRSLKAGQFRPA